MKKMDSILWRILALTGLNFINYRLRTKAKIFRMLFMITFTTSLMYIIVTNLCLIGIRRYYKEPIINSFTCIYSGLIWFIAYFKRKAISHLVLEVYRLRKCYNTQRKQQTFFIIFFIIITLIIPCISYLCNFARNFGNFNITCMTFGVEIQNKVWKNIIITIVKFVHFGIYSGFPFYFIICIGVLFYRCSEVLSEYKAFLRIKLHTLSNGIVGNMVDIFNIVIILNRLNKIFRHVSFFIILYSLQSTMTLFLRVTRQGFSEIGIFRIITNAYNFLCNIFLFVYFTICSSMIPESLVEIKKMVKKFLNVYRYSIFLSKENLFYLKRIENEDIVYITICGMFHLTRSYILTALGLMLTHGLLIINLNL